MPYPDGNNPQATDRELIAQLARHMRKHGVPNVDPDDPLREETRTVELLEWLADSVEVFNLPPREDTP
jgi:hypothetical protein